MRLSMTLHLQLLHSKYAFALIGDVYHVSSLSYLMAVTSLTRDIEEDLPSFSLGL